MCAHHTRSAPQPFPTGGQASSTTSLLQCLMGSAPQQLPVAMHAPAALPQMPQIVPSAKLAPLNNSGQFGMDVKPEQAAVLASIQGQQLLARVQMVREWLSLNLPPFVFPWTASHLMCDAGSAPVPPAPTHRPHGRRCSSFPEA